MARTLDPLHTYAAAFRFLNRVLHDEYVRRENFDSLYFISVNGELEEASTIFSHDPAYLSCDWVEALREETSATSVGAYATLLRFLTAFTKRGCDKAFQTAIARLEPQETGLPADPTLSRWWTDAWEEASNADLPGIVRMTHSPFIVR